MPKGKKNNFCIDIEITLFSVTRRRSQSSDFIGNTHKKETFSGEISDLLPLG